MSASPKIFVTGHRGLLGSAIVRKLDQSSQAEIITAGRDELDLLDSAAVLSFFKDKKIDQVYLSAAKVGGILANDSFPADFIYENLMIEANVIHAAHVCDVQKLLFVGTSCIYPKFAEQPMREDSMFSGMLEPTTEPYAVAKIAGIKLCESYNRQYERDYRSVMPTNLYGDNDNFHPENTHVIPALLRRFHEAVQKDASEVVIWGSGNAMREFLHIEDMASACIHVMNVPPDIYRQHTQVTLSHVNVGTGVDCTIRELAETIAKVTGFQGSLEFDTSKPDGMPRKLLDVSRLRDLGWEAKISLKQGLRSAYSWYIDNAPSARE